MFFSKDSRALFKDGWNSAAHVGIGALSRVLLDSDPGAAFLVGSLFVLYQLASPPSDPNVGIDIAEGLVGVLLASVFLFITNSLLK